LGQLCTDRIRVLKHPVRMYMVTFQMMVPILEPHYKIQIKYPRVTSSERDVLVIYITIEPKRFQAESCTKNHLGDNVDHFLF
jgi:hypothetical protein